MRKALLVLLAACLLPALAPIAMAQSPIAQSTLAPGGTLRAAYLINNLAQATRDPATGDVQGVAADVARDLGRRAGIPIAILPLANPVAVLAAVQDGTADIGFVAPNAERMVVLYSQTYMLVQQSFLVRENSPIHSVTELDRPGLVIGANTGDSIAFYLRTHFTSAKLEETPDSTLREPARRLADGTLSAFGGNRQRLRVSTQGIPGLRMLPDNLYAVPQAIAVANGRTEAMAIIDRTIDELRASGFLKASMLRARVDGIDVAPPRP